VSVPTFGWKASAASPSNLTVREQKIRFTKSGFFVLKRLRGIIPFFTTIPNEEESVGRGVSPDSVIPT